MQKRGHGISVLMDIITHIGECGGAMQTGKCIECGVKVGGSSHRLLADNEHAGEIDNTQHAAWSEGANLNNYDLRNIV